MLQKKEHALVCYYKNSKSGGGGDYSLYVRSEMWPTGSMGYEHEVSTASKATGGVAEASKATRYI